jgi:hypothetical protein
MNAEEIDLTQLVDQAIADCLRANLPPRPAIIAQTIADIVSRGASREEYGLCFAQLLVLTRARIDAAATVETVN